MYASSLLAIAVGRGCADAGRVVEGRDAEVVGVDVLAREASLDTGCALAWRGTQSIA